MGGGGGVLMNGVYIYTLIIIDTQDVDKTNKPFSARNIFTLVQFPEVNIKTGHSDWSKSSSYNAIFTPLELGY